MAVDKDFVIRNGIEVNENLIYADADTDKVGIGTTTPDKKLVVIGDTEVSSSLAVGTTITAQRGDFTGIITSHSGIDIGVGGTVLRTNTDTKKVGINSTIPRYTLDVIGPVSIGQTAEYVYGDLTVTGNINATSLSGQISAGGTVGFTNVTVDNNLMQITRRYILYSELKNSVLVNLDLQHRVSQSVLDLHKTRIILNYILQEDKIIDLMLMLVVSHFISKLNQQLI